MLKLARRGNTHDLRGLNKVCTYRFGNQLTLSTIATFLLISFATNQDSALQSVVIVPGTKTRQKKICPRCISHPYSFPPSLTVVAALFLAALALLHILNPINLHPLS